MSLTHSARLASAIALAVCGTVGASSANAELIVGLTTTGQLVSFDHNAPGVVIATSPGISGLNSGDSIVDIDYYPVTQSLHGIGASGVLYRINRLTGAATTDVTPQASIGTPRAIDFNPAADRLRVLSGQQNFRLTPSVNTAGPTGANAGLVSADGMFIPTVRAVRPQTSSPRRTRTTSMVPPPPLFTASMQGLTP